MLAVELPPALVAVTVYAVADCVAVGVPVILPVEVSNDKPVGKVPLMDQLVTAPPVLTGDHVAMAVPDV